MEIKIDNQYRLTSFRLEDKVNLIQYLNDKEVNNNTLVIPYPYTEKDAEEWLELVLNQEEKLGCLANWVIRDASGNLVGAIGRMLNGGKENHWDEIGYWLAAPFRGNGIMTRAVSAFTDYLFEHEGLVRVTAIVFPHNPASARVLEKAGFQREGYLHKHYKKDGKFLDGILFAKIKA